MDEHTIEKHVSYATTVAELSDAWSFVMAHTDEFERPQISISPTWTYSDSGPPLKGFSVSVSGMAF